MTTWLDRDLSRVRLQSSTDALRLGLAVVLLVAGVGLLEWRVAAFLVLPGSLVLAWLWVRDRGGDGDDLSSEERGRCPNCGRQLLADRSRCDYCTIDPEHRK